MRKGDRNGHLLGENAENRSEELSFIFFDNK